MPSLSQGGQVLDIPSGGHTPTKPKRVDRPPDLANLEQALIEKLHGNRKATVPTPAAITPHSPMVHYMPPGGQELLPQLASGNTLVPPVGVPGVGVPAVGVSAVGVPAVGVPAVGVPAVGVPPVVQPVVMPPVLAEGQPTGLAQASTPPKNTPSASGDSKATPGTPQTTVSPTTAAATALSGSTSVTASSTNTSTAARPPLTKQASEEKMAKPKSRFSVTVVRDDPLKHADSVKSDDSKSTSETAKKDVKLNDHPDGKHRNSSPSNAEKTETEKADSKPNLPESKAQKTKKAMKKGRFQVTTVKEESSSSMPSPVHSVKSDLDFNVPIVPDSTPSSRGISNKTTVSTAASSLSSVPSSSSIASSSASSVPPPNITTGVTPGVAPVSKAPVDPTTEPLQQPQQPVYPAVSQQLPVSTATMATNLATSVLPPASIYNSPSTTNSTPADAAAPRGAAASSVSMEYVGRNRAMSVQLDEGSDSHLGVSDSSACDVLSCLAKHHTALHGSLTNVAQQRQLSGTSATSNASSYGVPLARRQSMPTLPAFSHSAAPGETYEANAHSGNSVHFTLGGAALGGNPGQHYTVHGYDWRLHALPEVSHSEKTTA